MVPRAAVCAVICCCLLLTSPFAAVVGATQDNTSTTDGVDDGATDTNTSTTDGVDNGTENSTESVDSCFSDDGYEFTIGTQGPEIKMALHLSLLTNLGGPGVFGVELSGSIGGPPIIELRTGVVFDGIKSITGFLSDPFGPFGIAFDYTFELPVFGDGFSYEESDPPIDGPVEGTNC